MKEVKRWCLNKQFDDSDLVWIKNNSDNFSVKSLSTIYIQTSSIKQETMLYLKYDNLVLVTVVFLEPHEFYEDHFGRIQVL